jgi:hypothetical protein
MKKFKRKGSVISTHFSTYEVNLLESLAAQLVDMVSDGEPEKFAPATPAESDDPFVLWTKDLQSDPDEPEPLDDPVLKRLFPSAYPHDPAAASDFRRFTERDLRAKKISDAEVVLRGLGETDQGANPVRIPVAEADEWLRTLTSLRLAVATRLGIEDADSADELSELPDDDPRAFLLNIYDWLGFAQETLVSAL